MARQPRIDYPGAVHHIMNRGADHQVTFRNDDDRRLFLTIWAQAVARFGIVVCSFSLMDNHYHVLVISPDGQLSATLQFVGRSYRQQFNHHHDRDGALFRGRFHSILVDSDRYFDRCARYIELNPVAAGIVPLERLECYPWSSFQYFSGYRATPAWLSTEPLLNNFRNRQQLDRFIRSDNSDTFIDDFYDRSVPTSTVLGDNDFVNRVERKAPEFTGNLKPGVPDMPIEVVEAAVCSISGASAANLRASQRGQRNVPRTVAAQLGQTISGLTLAQLANRFAFPSAQAVSNSISRTRTDDDERVAQLRDSVLGALGRTSDGLRT